MYDLLLRAYHDKSKNIGLTHLEYAVTRGWITTKEKDTIINYTPSVGEFDTV